MRRVALAVVVLALAGGCRKMPQGTITHDASPKAQVGKPYEYNALGKVRLTKVPEDSFWFIACGDDAASGFAVAREGQITFTPKEARTYHLCVSLTTVDGESDTYHFDVTAAP